MPTNDNGPEDGRLVPASSDAHGRAALLLVESLIHGLCETAALNAVQAVEIAERAASVQFDVATATNGPAESMWQTHSLLMAIHASLSTDDNNRPPPRLVT